MPSTSRRPSPLTATAMITATETMRPSLAHLHIGRVQPDVGPVALERPVQEGRIFVDLAAQPETWLFEMPVIAHRLDQVVDRAGRDALDVGFLDHRRQRLLRHPARLQKAREVAALAQLRDAQLDRPGAGLPVAVAVPVAMVDAIGAAFAVAAPVRPSTSSSISRCAAKPIISRSRSVSEHFSKSA